MSTTDASVCDGCGKGAGSSTIYIGGKRYHPQCIPLIVRRQLGGINFDALLTTSATLLACLVMLSFLGAPVGAGLNMLCQLFRRLF